MSYQHNIKLLAERVVEIAIANLDKLEIVRIG